MKNGGGTWAKRPKWHRFESARSYATRQAALAGISIDCVERGLTTKAQPQIDRVWQIDSHAGAIIESAAGRRRGHYEQMAGRASSPDAELVGNRYLCRLCSAGETVQQISHDQENWCLRHPGQMVWVGPGTTPSSQVVIPWQKEQARAERLFRRLARSGRVDSRLHSRVWAMVRDNESLGHYSNISPSRKQGVASRAALYPTTVRILDALSNTHTLAALTSSHPEDLRAVIAKSINPASENSVILVERIVLWLRPIRRATRDTRLGLLDIPADDVDARAIIDTTADYPPWIRQHPQAVAEWDWARNPPERDPWALKGTMPKAWWVCTAGHSWEASPNTRGASKTNCRYCMGAAIWPGLNDLGTLFPDIAAEWDNSAEMNAGHDPDRISPSVHLKITWKCREGHRWPRSIRARITKPAGCPECHRARERTAEEAKTNLQRRVPRRHRRIVPGVNDLATTHPHLAREWAATNSLTAAEVASWSSDEVTWVCSLGHHWERSVEGRCASGSGCKVCSGKAVLAGFNDFASHYPHLVSEWDGAPLVNDRKPEEVTVSSPYEAGWRCRSGHTWRAPVSRRSRGHRCPECFGRHAPRAGRTLARLRPALSLEWDEDNEYEPQELSLTSRYVATWRCASGHRWRTEILSRVEGEECPNCERDKHRSSAVCGREDAIWSHPSTLPERQHQRDIILRPLSS